MIQHFINRSEELDFLNKRYSSGSPEFIILYGRRRVGKTEIIKQFIKNKPAVYFMADRQVERESLRQIQERMGTHLNDSLFEKASLGSFYELFSEFAKKTSDRVVFIIDEFQYLMETNKAVPSIFQKIWDEVLANTRIFLIICGSSISMMETLMGYKKPLYGRRTGQWKVELLEFKEAMKFLPNYSLEEQITAYAILDGIPQYLNQFDDTKTVIENIQNKIIEKGNFLHIEPEFLLKEELREPRNYFLILKAISFGYTKSGDIVNYTQLDKTLVSKYLDNLSILHIIEKNHPVETNKERTRDTRYKFSDNFFSFWFRFVYPNRSDIERGETEQVMSLIEKELNSFMGRKFEKICQEGLIEMNKKGTLPFRLKKIGGWWHKNREIDIIAMNEESREICLCECKWQSAKTGLNVLKELKEKSKFVDWFNNKRMEYYVVISKSGFTEAAIDYADTEKMLLFDINDLKKVFAKSNL